LNQDHPMSDPSTPPPALPHPITRRWHGPSLVWLVPLVAVVVGVFLMVRSILSTGPLIRIDFQSADGLRAGQTEVRFKEVAVGKVESVTLSDDHKRVQVALRLNPGSANLAVDDTQFWVVKPRIDIGGVSGLETLFSGAYIGVDAGSSGETRKIFAGLSTPPSFLRGEPGRGFVLRTQDLGSLDVGSPILYRRTRVGRVVGYQLDPATDELLVRMFIESPYEGLVNAQTRFWNASGIDFSINAAGLRVNTQTLSTVLAGGVAFERPSESLTLPAAPDGSRFTLFADRSAALAPPDGPALPVRMVFDQAMRGLAVGAPIEFLGMDIGQVTAIRPHFNPQQKRYPLEVLAELYPSRLGSGVHDTEAPGESAARNRALLQRLLSNHLAAQARSGNLLTGQLYIALDFAPGKPKPVPDLNAAVLTLPTTAATGSLGDLQPRVAEILRKINQVPFEGIGRNLNTTLQQASGAIGQLRPEAQKTLAEVQRTLLSAQTSLGHLDRNLLGPQAPLQQSAEQTMRELQRAAQSLKTLTDSLERHPESLLRGKPTDPAIIPRKPDYKLTP
jgi:paraquat-inducible protein B